MLKELNYFLNFQYSQGDEEWQVEADGFPLMTKDNEVLIKGKAYCDNNIKDITLVLTPEEENILENEDMIIKSDSIFEVLDYDSIKQEKFYLIDILDSRVNY